MVSTITRQEDNLYEALKPVVAPLDVDLIDVDVRDHQGEGVIKIIIDSPEGIGIEDCGRVSDQVEPVVKIEETQLYREARLEVTSPGVERRLRRPEEFDRYRGRDVRVKCYAPFQDRKEWIGRLRSSSDEALTLGVENEGTVTLPMNQVASVRLEFNAEKFLSSGGNQNGE